MRVALRSVSLSCGSSCQQLQHARRPFTWRPFPSSLFASLSQPACRHSLNPRQQSDVSVPTPLSPVILHGVLEWGDVSVVVVADHPQVTVCKYHV
jgi:hypothetical protein